MDNPDITVERYVQLETNRALRNDKVYNWETATYGKIWYDEDVYYLRFFEMEFLAIVYNDALASKSSFSSEPMVSPQHVDEVKNETSLSDYDDEKYNDYTKKPIHSVILTNHIVIIEQKVKVDQKVRILELKRRNYEEQCSDILYAVSIKEDMAYLCPKLHSTSTKRRFYTPYPEDIHTPYSSISRMVISEQVGLARDLGSTNDVMIPWVKIWTVDY
ncbi:hypothetical protein Tco_0719105 [Tanacetum coccineum]